MSSLSIQVADAVVSSLNGSGLPFQAERKWRYFGELQDAGITFVTVVPLEADWSNRDRSGSFVDVTVVVGVQKRIDELDPGDPNPPELQLDNMANLCEDVAVFLHGKDQGPGRFLSVKQDPLWVPEHYDQFHQFTGFIKATYRCAA